MGFFHPDNFKDYLSSPEDRRNIANIANEVIAKRGRVLFGRAYENNVFLDYSSIKNPTDTHVGIFLDEGEMMAFAPDEAYIKTTTTTEDDLVQAQARHIEVLEANLKRAREKDG